MEWKKMGKRWKGEQENNKVVGWKRGKKWRGRGEENAKQTNSAHLCF
jgi:hypothetical protein